MRLMDTENLIVKSPSLVQTRRSSNLKNPQIIQGRGLTKSKFDKFKI